jgi:uncharacterized protein (TIGR02099 family)
VTWILIAAAAFFSLLLLSLRYWVLPNIEQYREDIALALSRASGQHVTVGQISANWDGLRPHMMLGTISVYDREGNISLLLHRLEGTVSWRSILYGGLHFREIRIDQPDLIVRRDIAGVIHLAGFALENESGENENGFSNWLLRQKRVVINNASIVWQDDLRAAPELELLVNLLLENQDNRHRFGIRATPSAELAARLDMRGDFRGRSLDDPEQWRGQLFLQIDQANVALWQAWLPFPREIELKRGVGALRMWMGTDGLDIRKLTMDMRLSNVETQLAKNLPELVLSRVQGRVGWKKINDGVKEGFELSASRLSTFIPGKPQLQPLNFSLQMIPGQSGAAGSGRLSADKLNLQTLGDLTEYLPMADPLRNFLRQSSPRGEIDHVEAGWDGDLPSPSHFRAKGHFTNVGVKKSENLPAFGGITGNIDVTQRGGTLNISSRQASIELPDMFHEPLLLDTLTGQASWSTVPGSEASEFRFNNISFSNPYAAGISYGSYRTGRDGRGMIDIEGHLTRADVSRAIHYLPVRKDSPVRVWLEKSMAAGVITEARLHLKGNLDEFPFPQDQGIFRLSINTSGATVDLMPEWPRIENISGNIQIQGNRVEFNGPQAGIDGTKLSRIKLRIRDIGESGAMLGCEAEAAGETRQFLELAARYGAGSLAGTLSDQISIAGNGKLQIKLDTPLTSTRHPSHVKLAGSYQIIGNEINPGPDLPNLSDISGEIFFTESGISVNNIAARLFGGPMSLSSVDTRDGSIRMVALGKINLDNVYENWRRDAARSPQPWTRYLRGSAEWRGMVHIRNKLTSLSIESSLQGIASALPDPFSKAASDRIPLRFERKAAAVNQDSLVLSYGDIAAAKIRRILDESGKYQVERGAVAFGTASVPSPETPGISVSGTIRTLDLDQWRKIIGQAGQAGGAAEAFPNITGVDLQLGNLTVFGRRFTDIELGARKIDEIWHSTVASNEISGDINWNPSGNGKILARLDKLVVPTSQSTSSPSSSRPDPGTQAKHQQKNPPALDVIVNDLILGNMRLGHLELKGAQHEQNWRIDKLRLSSPDSSIVAKGAWQSRTATPRVQAAITVESSDIGKFLMRLGHPDRVKRGTGKLEGKVSWDGNPLAINYPTMSGTFKLQAERGQFPRFEPGIGRLFGIFDLRALPRRVMLDFRDVFSEGFAFDDISGNIKIAHGVAVTDDLEIEGPAASIILNGEVNLEAETQKLNFKVIPSLGLVTPVVGLTEMIVNKALQSTPAPNEYDITGTWTNPIVVKKSGQAQERETDEPVQQ